MEMDNPYLGCLMMTRQTLVYHSYQILWYILGKVADVNLMRLMFLVEDIYYYKI